MIKETIGNATLYLGDCLPVMAQFENKELDAVVTDPPYGIDIALKNIGGARNNHYWSNSKLNNYRKSDWDSKPPSLKHFIQMKRIAEYQIIFGGNYFGLDASSCWLVWDKKNGRDNFSDCELAWTNLNQGVRMISYLWAGFKKQKPEVRYHPTQKPLTVMEWCIEQIKLNPESTIIDPFMGSGTTGIACHRLGHKFIGIEKDEEYFEIACKRIEQAQRQQNLFEPQEMVAT